jgi:hypothetical protein
VRILLDSRQASVGRWRSAYGDRWSDSILLERYPSQRLSARSTPGAYSKAALRYGLYSSVSTRTLQQHQCFLEFQRREGPALHVDTNIPDTSANGTLKVFIRSPLPPNPTPREPTSNYGGADSVRQLARFPRIR